MARDANRGSRMEQLLEILMKGVLAVPAETEVQFVQMRDLGAETHQTIASVAMVDGQGMCHFVQSHFGQALVIEFQWRVAAILIVSQVKTGDDRGLSTHGCFAKNMGEDRVAQVHRGESEYAAILWADERKQMLQDDARVKLVPILQESFSGNGYTAHQLDRDTQDRLQMCHNDSNRDFAQSPHFHQAQGWYRHPRGCLQRLF